MSWRSRAGRWLRTRATNERNYTVLRIESLATLQRVRNTLTPAHGRRLESLAKARELSINLGSGGRGLPGWVNMDLTPASDDTLPHDIRRGLPFTDGSARRVMAEHVIEHLHFTDEAPRVLAEVLRVLAPGGVLRVVVPDAERFARAYVSRDPEQWRALGWDLDQLPHDIHSPMHVLNHVFQQGGEHLFAYDFETLAWLLRSVGFARVEHMRFGESLDAELAIDRSEHAPYSLYVDAQKAS